ncbi:MAG: serine/threonine protein kinase [Symploca sp. SIO2G7]|nr:serine/threonine protein kinase [Symploca sp. SIO2G7]
MVWNPEDQLQGGKYTIQKVLGQGRFGITYLARDNKGDGVVIKTLNEGLLNSLSQLKRQRLESKFQQEAPKLQSCQHHHIAQFIEKFSERGLDCLVMEYIAGVDLASRKHSILKEKEALRYIQQIGEALIEVHRHDWVHRDVKPANIMVRFRDGKSEAVLIDFGLVREFHHDLTVTTPEKEAEKGFAPIEMYQPLAERRAYTDVYSLAATLYNLLTGKVPPHAEDLSRNHVRLEEPKTINPKISDRINKAIMTGMISQSQARPQTMEKWLELLGLKPPLIRLQRVESTIWANWSQVVIAVETALLVWLTLIPLLRNSSPTPNQLPDAQQEIPETNQK